MPDQDFAGSWRGQWSDGSGVVELTMTVDRGSFSAALTAGPERLPETRFTQGPRADVYEGQIPRGIMGWLALGSSPDTLEGQPLNWGRVDPAGALHLYHFELASTGTFDLLHIELVTIDNSLRLRLFRNGTGGIQPALSAVMDRQ